MTARVVHLRRVSHADMRMMREKRFIIGYTGDNDPLRWRDAEGSA